MPFSGEFMKKVAQALENASPATRENLLKRYSMTITARRDGTAYFNPRVTNAVDRSVSSPVTHLQFTTMRDEGCIIVRACDSEAPGAEEVARSDSQRTFTVNMKAALQDLVADLPEHRKIRYKVDTATVDVDGAPHTVLIVKVKERQSRKVKSRAKAKKDQAKASTTDSGTTSASPPESSAANGDAEGAS